MSSCLGHLSLHAQYILNAGNSRHSKQARPSHQPVLLRWVTSTEGPGARRDGTKPTSGESAWSLFRDVPRHGPVSSGGVRTGVQQQGPAPASCNTPRAMWWERSVQAGARGSMGGRHGSMGGSTRPCQHVRQTPAARLTAPVPVRERWHLRCGGARNPEMGPGGGVCVCGVGAVSPKRRV